MVGRTAINDKYFKTNVYSTIDSRQFISLVISYSSNFVRLQNGGPRRGAGKRCVATFDRFITLQYSFIIMVTVVKFSYLKLDVPCAFSFIIYFVNLSNERKLTARQYNKCYKYLYMTLVMKSSKNQISKVLQIFYLKTNIYN